MNDKIIVALDSPSLAEATRWIDNLPDAVTFKVGLQAYLKFGLEIIQGIKTRGKKLFLDLKFKDIPNTVSGAVESSLTHSPRFLTIHLTGGAEMIRQAVNAGRHDPDLTLLGVTVLTSLSEEDLRETGVMGTPQDTVLKLCDLGLRNGITAVVCSPLEIEPIRREFGDELTLVTPGIRPAGSAVGDQKRVFTPRMAMEAGSDYLVIGRPITQHRHPADAFMKIVQEIS